MPSTALRRNVAPSTGLLAESLAEITSGRGLAWLEEEVAEGFLVGAALDFSPLLLKKTSPQAHDVAALVAASTKLLLMPLRRSTASSSTIITIGRMNGNDVCIRHPDVSRFHAFLHEDDGFALVDADSTNGTFIDGVAAPQRRAAAPPARLRSKQLIRFGPVTTAFVDASDASAMLQGLRDGARPDWLDGLSRSRPRQLQHQDSDAPDCDLQSTRRMSANAMTR